MKHVEHGSVMTQSCIAVTALNPFLVLLFQFLCLKNIRTFLSTCCEKFGLRKSELFEVFDLFDVKDFGKVCLLNPSLSQNHTGNGAGFRWTSEHFWHLNFCISVKKSLKPLERYSMKLRFLLFPCRDCLFYFNSKFWENEKGEFRNRSSINGQARKQ